MKTKLVRTVALTAATALALGASASAAVGNPGDHATINTLETVAIWDVAYAGLVAEANFVDGTVEASCAVAVLTPDVEWVKAACWVEDVTNGDTFPLINEVTSAVAAAYDGRFQLLFREVRLCMYVRLKPYADVTAVHGPTRCSPVM